MVGGAVAGEEKGAGAAGQDIVHCTGHLVTHGPDDLDRLNGKRGGELAAELGCCGQQFLKSRSIGAIIAEVAELRSVLMMAVDVQRLRHARPLVQFGQGGGVVHAVLGHFPVGGPLAAGDGEQPGPGHLDGVLARQGGSARRLGLDQWADAGKYAENVGARRMSREVTRSGVQNEIDLFLQSDRFQAHVFDRRVGSPDQRVLVPWNGEQHTAVAGPGNHDRGVTRQEGALKHDMDEFARKHCPRTKVAELYLYAQSIPSEYAFNASVPDPEELLGFVKRTLGDKN